MKKIKTINFFGIIFIICGILILAVAVPVVDNAYFGIKELCSSQMAYGVKLTEDNLKEGKIDKEYAGFVLSTLGEKQFIVDHLVNKTKLFAIIGVLVILFGVSLLSKYKRKYNEVAASNSDTADTAHE